MGDVLNSLDSETKLTFLHSVFLHTVFGWELNATLETFISIEHYIV